MKKQTKQKITFQEVLDLYNQIQQKNKITQTTNMHTYNLETRSYLTKSKNYSFVKKEFCEETSRNDLRTIDQVLPEEVQYCEIMTRPKKLFRLVGLPKKRLTIRKNEKSYKITYTSNLESTIRQNFKDLF